MATPLTPVGSGSENLPPNHPLAVRMGVIAGVSHNMVIGTIMGSFGLMLASVEQRLNVSGEAAAAGIPLLLVGASVLAPFVGVLVAKVSLRLLLLIGALLTVVGYLTLAFTNSYALYLVAYGLCFGPALSLAGSIGPATLVTRWFNRNRGLALGIVHLPVVIALVPWTLDRALSITSPSMIYLSIGLLCAVLLLPLTLLAIDHPPGETESLAPEPAENRTSDGSLSIAQLLARPRFWAICLASIASMTGSVLLGSLLVPMGLSWGFTRPEAALLQSIMSLVGIAGSVLFGLISDRLGGGRSLALIGFNCAICWLILLQHPPFWLATVAVGVIGMHGAGAIPALGRGLSDAFGQASYSRGFGLNTLIGLPFIGLSVVGSARLFSVTGSYDQAIVAMVVFFVAAIGLGLYAAGGATPKEMAAVAA